MPGALDEALGAVAQELIDDLGKTITMDVTTGGTYSAATRKRTGESPTGFTANVSPPVPLDSKYFDEDTLKHSTTMVFMARKGSTFTPKENQVWNMSATQKMTVVGVKEFFSGDLIAAWAVALRQ